MRLCHLLPALLTLAAASSLLAADKESNPRPSLFQRAHAKPKTAEPVQVVVLQTLETKPLPVTEAPVTGTPAPLWVAPTTSTPCVNCSDPNAAGMDSMNCPSRMFPKYFKKLDSPRPALSCDDCSTFRCEWRFMWGSCRAFYREGPYAPRYPDNCPCGK